MSDNNPNQQYWAGADRDKDNGCRRRKLKLPVRKPPEDENELLNKDDPTKQNADEVETKDEPKPTSSKLTAPIKVSEPLKETDPAKQMTANKVETKDEPKPSTSKLNAPIKIKDDHDYAEEKLPKPIPTYPEDDGLNWWGDPRDERKDAAKIQPIKTVKAGNNNFHVLPDEKMEYCPYNHNHYILEARFARHLLKCRAAYEKKCEEDNVPMAISICPFNRMHHYPISYMNSHIERCPDRIKFVEDAKKIDRIRAVKREKPSCSKSVEGKNKVLKKQFEEEEDWGFQADAAPYDPRPAMQKADFIIVPPGLTKSQRRQYKADEIARRNEIEYFKRKKEEEEWEKAHANANETTKDDDDAAGAENAEEFEDNESEWE